MMKNIGLIFLAILSVLLVSCGQELNLDRRPDFDELNFRELKIPYADEQKIITRVKDVSVKSVPFPFNGGIIKNSKNDWVLFFREQQGENNNKIGFVALNEDFEFKEGPFYLKGDPTLEDPRIVQSFLGRIALVANKADSSDSRRQIVVIDGQEGPSGLPSFTAEKIIVSSKTEKNWSPFFWEEELFFSYGIENSHAVLSEKKICSQQRCFFNGEFSYKTTSTEWAWGKMRGGTPAQFLKN